MGYFAKIAASRPAACLQVRPRRRRRWQPQSAGPPGIPRASFQQRRRSPARPYIGSSPATARRSGAELMPSMASSPFLVGTLASDRRWRDEWPWPGAMEVKGTDGGCWPSTAGRHVWQTRSAHKALATRRRSLDLEPCRIEPPTSDHR
jgi:hypothetical protein